MLIKNSGNFVVSAYSVYADNQLSAYTVYADRKLTKYQTPFNPLSVRPSGCPFVRPAKSQELKRRPPHREAELSSTLYADKANL